MVRSGALMVFFWLLSTRRKRALENARISSTPSASASPCCNLSNPSIISSAPLGLAAVRRSRSSTKLAGVMVHCGLRSARLARCSG
ncbi:hypothetical protein D3C75_1304880 [compost metagenome]